MASLLGGGGTDSRAFVVGRPSGFFLGLFLACAAFFFDPLFFIEVVGESGSS